MTIKTELSRNHITLIASELNLTKGDRGLGVGARMGYPPAHDYPNMGAICDFGGGYEFATFFVAATGIALGGF